ICYSNFTVVNEQRRSQSGAKSGNAFSYEIIVSGFAGYNEAEFGNPLFCTKCKIISFEPAHSVPTAFPLFVEDGN
ncbi:hypothetical protein, partial [Companilactobacillus crustorum]